MHEKVYRLDGDFFYGVRLAQPLLEVFENDLGTSPTYKRDFALEGVDFFSISIDEQFEGLVEFLRQASRLV